MLLIFSTNSLQMLLYSFSTNVTIATLIKGQRGPGGLKQ
jgi:hypothetical protein